jgi:hypothetical protein
MSILCQNHHTVIAYLFPNCSRIVHVVYPICVGMKQGRRPLTLSGGEKYIFRHFYMIIKCGTAGPLDKWLKRTIQIKCFSHLMSCHFCHCPLDIGKASTLDLVFKVQSIFRRLMDFFHNNLRKFIETEHFSTWQVGS